MLKFLILLLLGFIQTPVIANDKYETNISIECYASKKYEIENFIASIEIAIKKTDMNKDPSNPPRWFTSQSIQIKSGGQANNASLLMNKNNQIAFSYIEAGTNDLPNNILHVFELNSELMEIKKTSMNIFNKKNNSINSTVLYCKK